MLSMLKMKSSTPDPIYKITNMKWLCFMCSSTDLNLHDDESSFDMN